jgi:hypothetical protein
VRILRALPQIHSLYLTKGFVMAIRVSKLFSILLLVILVEVATTNSQTVVVINASKDNTLYEEPAGATSNGAGEYFFVGRTHLTTNSIRRGLIAFNLAGRIPSGATITNVTLSLNMSKSNAGDKIVNLHRVIADWGEGTSDAGGQEGSGAPATTNDATWIHRFFSSSLWTTVGGTFSATPSASATVGGIARYTWGSTSGMVSDVQQWLSTPATNFGWILIGDESVGSTAKRFDTKENVTVANRPSLTVTYTTTSVVEEGIPSTFVLHQNYPNPFNPSTTIRFELPSRAHTTLKVFNLIGQQVDQLVNGNLSAGFHSTEWRAEGMSSGVYVYRLEADGVVATRKLVLAR